MSIRQFQPQYLNAPRNFVALPDQPICLEIGAGKGKHALLFSGQHPDQHLVAIERTKEKFMAMQKQHALEGQKNLTTIHADAIPWIVHGLYPKQVQHAFILYPNPEPHNATQRWLNMPFFEFLISRVADNGTITLASNIPEYIHEAEQQLQQLWKLPYEKQIIAKDSARTHFEIKYLERGELCQQLVITRPVGYTTRFDEMPPRLGQAIHG